jgi:hypothetical protein
MRVIELLIHLFIFSKNTMPTLAQSLPSKDLGHLRIVAALWGIELTSPDPAEASLELAETLCDAELLEEIVAALPAEGHAALEALFAENGRMPWVNFTRRFGEIREMGQAKRDREQPHLRPASGAETLYYRALLARAFFDTPKGPQEFAYIPEDLREALEFIGFEPSLLVEATPEPESEPEPEEIPARPGMRQIEPQYESLPEPEYTDIEEFESEPDENLPPLRAASQPRPPISAPEPRRPLPPPPPVAKPAPASTELGRAATPAEKAHITLASDQILDDATTLLAALRMGLDAPSLSVPAPVLTALLAESRLIRPALPEKGTGSEEPQPNGGWQIVPEPVKTFLEAPRTATLQGLVESWQSSTTFDELRQIPGLACEGGWSNQPLVTREFLLDLLENFEKSDKQGIWWSISAFLRDIKQKYPDFQRPAGDYDSWFIKRESDGVFLRGFAHWDDIDGALIRYFLQVLHWLGQVDLASAEKGGVPTAFRLSSLEQKEEKGKIIVSSNGRISVERLTPRPARYQIARFCEWVLPRASGGDDTKDDEYRYRVTPRSLKKATEQGLKVSQLLGLLAKHTGGQVPPAFIKALQRWEVNGTEARVENLVVLRVSKPDVLNELRASKAGRFLGEIIGPTTVTVQGGAIQKVMAALAELGLLADGDLAEHP